MVPQVPIIGILMLVNGGLCILYGALLIFLGPFMSNFLNMQGAQAPPQAQPQMQQMQNVFQVISIVYIVLGSAAALAGVMNIAGGIAALRFRSRGLVITSLFFNVAAFGTCYCLPTSLGLMIWGLIVMFQGDVAEAFKLGGQGYGADEIKRRLNQAAKYRRDDDDRDDDRDDRDRWRERDADATDRPPPPPPRRGDAGDEGIFEK